MTTLANLYLTMIEAMGVEGLEIPMTAIKFYQQGDEIPAEVKATQPENISLTSCQALRQAGLGDSALITLDNIGCVAAAITFGLVDKDQDKPLSGPRVYTNIMNDQQRADFVAPSPRQFSDGTVYACKSAGHQEFALFGEEDTGRFDSQATAQKAISDMMAVQPANTQGVFFYSKEFTDIDVTPDVIVFSVRPVELARIIQAYQFHTGERVNSSMGGVRVVNSDLIVRPYLTQDINISTYCIGARLIAHFEADRMGIGMPYSKFVTIAKGMKDSRNGFPFHLYPGAEDSVYG